MGEDQDGDSQTSKYFLRRVIILLCRDIYIIAEPLEGCLVIV